MTSQSFQIRADRLRTDIETTGAFGAVDASEGRGRTVLTGSTANRNARDRLVKRFEEAGLEVRVDAVGNIAGRWVPPSADPTAAPVAVGSHLDSVPRGGIFDGPLGVYAGLEAVRAMQDAARTPERPIEVVSFTEEEGVRFADGLLGSSVASGHRSVEDALTLTDDDGVTLSDALADIGYRGDGHLDASEWDAWLELHVEQSTRLEDAGVPVGVVTTIAGVTHGEVTVTGSANHAGSTPMAERTDALTAASEFVLSLEAAVTADERPETLVGTVGQLDVEPGAVNVIPGAVTASLDVRDTDAAVIEDVIDGVRAELDRLEADRGVITDLHRDFTAAPTDMSERLRDTVHAAADRLGIDTLDLHSGAFHDTMYVADVTDAALLFAPSRDGISHSPREWTDWDDCATATAVLAETLATLSGA
ncbi:Zn-dependent hydrolase [Haloplanus aerogenes]|uniref:N-carbamoyl-L-amino-acid hydrolase n=1 Tax=Haloplanus aerogenes TaxID=660522 RepID=A0A3M0DY72_9EURY|nr:Zn-dependent hydrolase [Haloplanus aerogenes]AZH24208.1 Zn-dependent hydrolase [Haloplanus aerogenes]RMB24166.1 N-carbamoyl-L-amino-acid hydrolase [Haloplanus aerogenes]